MTRARDAAAPAAPPRSVQAREAGRPGARPPLRAAIACSGLGHVRRGNEMGARVVADGLHRLGVDVVLFGGGPRPEVACRYERIASLPREAAATRRLLSWHHRYLLEQYSFDFFLRRRLRRDRFDVVQVADPALALRLHRASPELATRVLYQDSQLLGPVWSSKFRWVQVLAPHYRELAREAGVDTSGWSVVPYPVDTRRYAPPADRAAVRAGLQGGALPADAFVVLAVGDFSGGSNKRLDWVVREAAAARTAAPLHLVLVGQASAAELEGFRRSARAVLGDRVHLAANVRPEEMPAWYAAADVFVHAALREPFGIVFLEALATGVPVLAHPFAVTEWSVGPGGEMVDMTAPGRLAAALAAWEADPALRRSIGGAGRERASAVFATERVVPLYLEAYERVLAG
ncbi:MAG TPA: glycosyltransferase family 4 protein [Longimicrobiaceae bacterium]|nr:glycosyltransferase family 4 protein [Longimicrobiaceae bacterium]